MLSLKQPNIHPAKLAIYYRRYIIQGMSGIEMRPEQGRQPQERIGIKPLPNRQGFYMDFSLSDGRFVPREGLNWTRITYGLVMGKEIIATMDFIDGRISPSRTPSSAELSGFFTNAISQVEHRALAERFRQKTAEVLPMLRMHEFLNVSAQGIIKLGEETLRRLHQAA